MKNKIIIFLVIVTILLIVSIISLKNIVKKSQTVIISINSEKIELNKNAENNQINLKTFNSEKAAIVKYESGNAKVKINGQELEKNSELSCTEPKKLDSIN